MIGETNASTSAGGSSVYYGTCSTSAGTAAKTVTVGEKFKLTEGAMIVVTFTNANTASTPTLNVTPSGGSATGAKSIRINASSALNTTSNPETDYFTVRGTCEFIYDGTYWILVTGRKTSRPLQLNDSSGTSLGVYYPTGQSATQTITLPGGSRELTDVQAVFTLQATPDYAEFPYCAEITDSAVTPNTYVSVTYSNEQSQSLIYSPTAVSDTGKIKLYARQAVGTQTIPTIGLGLDYVDLDSSQPITSPIETRDLALVSSSDTEYSGFPYKYSFVCVGATAVRTAQVMFGVEDAQSGNFASECETGAGVIYIWAHSAQSTADIGYMLYYVDTVADISNLVTTDTAQTITGRKTIYNTTTAELPIQTAITSAGDIGGVGYYDGNGGMIIKTWGTTTGKYTIELLDGSQKSAQVINQRAYNSANTSDIVTISTMRDYACKSTAVGEWAGTITSGVYGSVTKTLLTKDTALLQFSLTIDPALGTISDSWVLPYTPWESALGISIDKSVACAGTWALYQNYSPYAVRIDRMGYAAIFDLAATGLRIGRVYTTTGSWGNWNLQSLEGLFEGTIVVRLA